MLGIVCFAASATRVSRDEYEEQFSDIFDQNKDYDTVTPRNVGNQQDDRGNEYSGEATE